MNKSLVVLVVGLLFITSILILMEEKDSELDFNGLKINSEDYNSITEPLPEGRFVLCSIKDNKCNVMFKGGLE